MPRTNESFLHRVLRQVRRPKDQASDRVKAITGGGREDFECLVVSAAGRLNEIAPHPFSITSTAWLARAVCYDAQRRLRYSNNATFWLDVVNALTGRRKWTGAQVLEAIAELDALELETIEQDRALVVRAIDLVERHGLIAYDACYLALAMQLDSQLLTLDRQLANAAGAGAVALDGNHRLADKRATYEREVTWPDYQGASAYLTRLRAEA